MIVVSMPIPPHAFCDLYSWHCPMFAVRISELVIYFLNCCHPHIQISPYVCSIPPYRPPYGVKGIVLNSGAVCGQMGGFTEKLATYDKSRKIYEHLIFVAIYFVIVGPQLNPRAIVWSQGGQVHSWNRLTRHLLTFLKAWSWMGCAHQNFRMHELSEKCRSIFAAWGRSGGDMGATGASRLTWSHPGVDTLLYSFVFPCQLMAWIGCNYCILLMHLQLISNIFG